MKIYSSSSVPVDPVEHGEGVAIRWLIGAEQGAPNFAMRLLDIRPGGASPYHSHAEEHEVYVLEGRGIVRQKGADLPFQAGDVIFINPYEEHQLVNVGDGMLRFICVIPILKR